MKQKEKNKIILTFLIFILYIPILGLIFYKNIRNNQILTITASVKDIRIDYIIVEDNNNIEYKLNNNESLNINDIAEITINNIKKKETPIIANIKELKIISKSISFTIDDNTKIEDVDNND